MEPKLANDFMPLKLLRLISNNLEDSVSVTNIIPAIKTDHAAISLDFNISQNYIKGPGYWTVNCSLLDDDNYQREVTAKMLVWVAESRYYLPDHRCIWDWIKYNLRAHVVQISKRKAKAKKIRRTYYKMILTMQSKRSNVFAHGSDGVNTVKRVQNIFSIWRKGTTSKKHVRKLKINGTIATDPFKFLSEEKRFYQVSFLSYE